MSLTEDRLDPLEVALKRLLSLTKASIEERSRLQHALETRIVVEQAKGVLAERLRLSPEEAYGLLRRAARDARVRVHDLAGDVVESRDTPKAIVATLGRLEARAAR